MSFKFKISKFLPDWLSRLATKVNNSIKIIFILFIILVITSVSEKPWYLMQKLLLRINIEEQQRLTPKKKPVWDIDSGDRIHNYEILEEDEANDKTCHDFKNTRIRRYKPGSIEPR